MRVDMIEGTLTGASFTVHNSITKPCYVENELKPMAVDGVTLLVQGGFNRLVVGSCLAYKLVDACSELVHDSFFRFMIRVISSRCVEGGCALAFVQGCIGGFVSLDPSHEIGVLHGGRLVCMVAFEGFGIDVKGLDSERHVV